MVGCLVCLCVCVVGSRVRNIGVCSFSKEDVLPRKASFTYCALTFNLEHAPPAL